MEEERVYSLEIDGQFFPEEEPLWVHGTAGQILEQIADEMGIWEEDEFGDSEFSEESDYPSLKAYRAHQAIEERMGRLDAYENPDALVNAMIREGFARPLTDDELSEWLEDEEMEDYDEARSELDEEWTDGVWET